MILNSFPFLFFFACVLLFYWKIKPKYQWLVLLLSGYVFFATGKPVYLLLIIASTFVNYFSAIAIYQSKKHKKRYLLLALLFDLGALFIFKYFDFFSETLNQILPRLNLLLPLGISFYTLQIIGYLFDVYNGKIKPEKNIKIFALFHCFFPQLSAGPIERGKSLLPQLKKQHGFDYLQAAGGVKLFTVGLFKKLVIADNLGLIVDRVFGSLPEYKGLSLVIAVFLYSWQIYMDFSGYTDMARGAGRMLGIELMENFNFPYFAASVRDFWRRWHISFTSWLREFVYFPLGGNRRGIVKTVTNTLFVFTISGLWHGAAWHFVVWGILHGLWMSVELLVNKSFGKFIRMPKFLQILYAYLSVGFLWIFFRAENLPEALYLLRYSFTGFKNFISPNYIWATLEQVFVFNKAEMVITLAVLSIAVFGEIIRRKTTLVAILSRQPALVRFAFYCFLLFAIIQFRDSNIKEFIYTKF